MHHWTDDDVLQALNAFHSAQYDSVTKVTLDCYCSVYVTTESSSSKLTQQMQQCPQIKYMKAPHAIEPNNMQQFSRVKASPDVLGPIILGECCNLDPIQSQFDFV